MAYHFLPAFVKNLKNTRFEKCMFNLIMDDERDVQGQNSLLNVDKD